MIRNANIAHDAQIDASKIQGAGLGAIAGEVHWVGAASSQAYAWLQSRVGSDNLHKTLQAAVDKTVASRGDRIIIAPGHSESIEAAGALDLNKAGIDIIGLGSGAMRPTFTFETAITADMDVDAANITMENILFVNGIDNLTAPIDINAAGFTMISCETRDNNSSYHCDDFIVSDDNAEYLRILDWVHDANGGKTGAVTALTMVGGDNIEIVPRYCVGAFTSAIIEHKTTTCPNLRIYGSANSPAYLRSTASTDVLITIQASTYGQVGPYILGDLSEDADNITEALVGPTMSFFAPIEMVNGNAETSMEYNATESTDAAGA